MAAFWFVIILTLSLSINATHQDLELKRLLDEYPGPTTVHLDRNKPDEIQETSQKLSLVIDQLEALERLIAEGEQDLSDLLDLQRDRINDAFALSKQLDQHKELIRQSNTKRWNLLKQFNDRLMLLVESDPYVSFDPPFVEDMKLNSAEFNARFGSKMGSKSELKSESRE